MVNLLGCSTSLSCGAGDVDDYYAKVTITSYIWMAVDRTRVKLVIKWKQSADGSYCVCLY